jgi:hypothetical protein
VIKVSYSWAMVYQDALDERVEGWDQRVATAENIFFTRGQELALSQNQDAAAELECLCQAAKHLAIAKTEHLDPTTPSADRFRSASLGIDLDKEVPIVLRAGERKESGDQPLRRNATSRVDTDCDAASAVAFRASVASRFWRSS